MTLSTRTEIVTALASALVTDSQSVFRRKEILKEGYKLGLTYGKVKGALTLANKLDRGRYDLSDISADVAEFTKTAPKNVVAMSEEKAPVAEVPVASNDVLDGEVYIPAVLDEYVAWGNFTSVLKVIKSSQFFPSFITGLSGNGKTMMVEQAAAKSKREFVRVQITPETDEDDLIGGFRLKNGDTVFEKGPVVRAMERGAILLIDEIDRGSNRLMAIQGVLEGKPVLIKKTGEVVHPAPGFNVIATANTKGQGSIDGRFAAATVIDEAFLERFPITIEQEYPTPAIETKILTKHAEKFGTDTKDIELLVKWAQTIRETFKDGGIDDVISTRRLCQILQSNGIFDDLSKSIEMCIARFDEASAEAFLQLFQKISAELNSDEDEKFADNTIDTIPF